MWLFVLRLSASGRAFHVAFASQAAEAFLEGHVLAFQALGGCLGGSATTTCGPRSTGSCRAATGPGTSDSSRWVATTGSTLLLPARQARRTPEGRGRGEIGRFRRRLVPISVVTTMSELNEHLAAAGRADDDRHIGNRRTTVGADFTAERPHLLPLPTEPFDTARVQTARVDHKARICVRQC